MIHLQLRLFVIRDIVEDTVKQGTAVLLADPFDLDPYPYNGTVPVLFSELEPCGSMALYDLLRPGHHHLGVLPIGHLRGVALHHFLILSHSIAGQLRHTVRKVNSFKYVRHFIDGHTARNRIDDVLHLFIGCGELLLHLHLAGDIAVHRVQKLKAA